VALLRDAPGAPPAPPAFHGLRISPPACRDHALNNPGASRSTRSPRRGHPEPAPAPSSEGSSDRSQPQGSDG
jgi:hypothetical protein